VTDLVDDPDQEEIADHGAELVALAGRLGHDFSDLDLLRQAVAHRSWCAEHGGSPSNERLEFLGDSVLGLIVTAHTYGVYPDLSESELSRLRAAVVSAATLAEAATELGLGRALLLGKGEAATGGRDKTSILADALEAVIGAIYLDGGWNPVRRLVLRLLGERIGEASLGPGDHDYKSQLQELVARQGVEPPAYRLHEAGPDHRKTFEADVFVDGEVLGRGRGTTKKAAEQAAARAALTELRPEWLHAGTGASRPPLHQPGGGEDGDRGRHR
jgi:ribonuclease III